MAGMQLKARVVSVKRFLYWDRVCPPDVSHPADMRWTHEKREGRSVKFELTHRSAALPVQLAEKELTLVLKDPADFDRFDLGKEVFINIGRERRVYVLPAMTDELAKRIMDAADGEFVQMTPDEAKSVREVLAGREPATVEEVQGELPQGEA